MLPTNDDCDDCKPGGPSMLAPATLITSYIPFVLVFLLVATFVHQSIYPSLSGEPRPVKASSPSRQPSRAGWTQSRPTSKKISAITFASTIALAAVLALLILCETSNYVDPYIRGLAIQFTISLLLLVLIIIIPFLEIYFIIFGTGNESSGTGNKGPWLAWLLQFSFCSAWLIVFWWSGDFLLGRGQDAEASAGPTTTQSIGEASLRRIGVIGISSMSLLSGFASVSSPWHAFFARSRTVTENTVNRRAAGLQSAQDMLAAKRSRLRLLERKISEPTAESLFQKAIGSIRGNPDSTERQALLIEVKGLEDMCSSLSSSHSTLQSRYNQQNASKTLHGRITRIVGAAFSAFCLFRIGTTFLTFSRRSLFYFTHSEPAAVFTTGDPVDSTLALLAQHYDPQLDHAVWARAISFLLSGVILFASFGSVMQTFHFFARFMPSLLKAIQANLALVVAQVCATYVISAALMLRSMVPGGIVGEGLRGLGGGVGRMGWVDAWFERWFLAGVVITTVGIWLGRQVGGSGEDDDDFDDAGGAVEMGKLS